MSTAGTKGISTTKGPLLGPTATRPAPRPTATRRRARRVAWRREAPRLQFASETTRTSMIPSRTATLAGASQPKSADVTVALARGDHSAHPVPPKNAGRGPPKEPGADPTDRECSRGPRTNQASLPPPRDRRRRWRSNPSGKCSYERPTRGTVCGTMRSMCGADAGCVAIHYQSLEIASSPGPTPMQRPHATNLGGFDRMKRSCSEDAKSEMRYKVAHERDWYFIAEQPAPAPHLARPEGRAAFTHMC